MKEIDLRETARKFSYVFFYLAEVLLVMRFVVSLFDTDYTNSFIRWVYTMSEPLLLPFRGIFPDVEYANVHVLEFPVLFAIAAYAVVAYVVIAVLYWLPTPPAKKTKK